MKKDQIASEVGTFAARKPSEGHPRVAASESGVLPRMVGKGHCQRPSWDEVDEYVREGKHRSLVEGYAAADSDFAEVLRWMRNDVEAEEIDTDSTRTPVHGNFSGARARILSSLPPPAG